MEEKGARAPGRAAAYDRFCQVVDGPMLVLAICMVPILLVPLVHRLRGSAAAGFDAASYVIWALFIVEYVVKVTLAPDRWGYVRGHLIDLAVIAIPFLRPVRALRLLRLIRLSWLGAWAVKGVRSALRVLRHRGLHFALLAVVILVFVGAAAELAFEARSPGSTIRNYGDALWWAAVTVTTVGYGDKVPITAAGRGVATVLMITGISLFGLLSATISSYFIESASDGIGARIDSLAEHLGRVEAMLETVLAERPDDVSRQRQETLAGDESLLL
jgi:voltage-gated potassium channel